MRLSGYKTIKALIDAIPDVVMIVDEDVRVYAYNEASSSIFDHRAPAILKRRAGEIIHCLYFERTEDGCGRSQFCEDCVIRNSVLEAISGKKVVRKKHKLQLIRGAEVKNIYALVSASPLSLDGKTLALLVIEDINEIVELKGLIPVCLKCKRVKVDKDYWVALESYITKHLDVDFTHGLCPECKEAELKRLRQS